MPWSESDHYNGLYIAPYEASLGKVSRDCCTMLGYLCVPVKAAVTPPVQTASASTVLAYRHPDSCVI